MDTCGSSERRRGGEEEGSGPSAEVVMVRADQGSVGFEETAAANSNQKQSAIPAGLGDALAATLGSARTLPPASFGALYRSRSRSTHETNISSETTRYKNKTMVIVCRVMLDGWMAGRDETPIRHEDAERDWMNPTEGRKDGWMA